MGPINDRVPADIIEAGQEHFNTKYKKHAKKLGISVGGSERIKKQPVKWVFESLDLQNNSLLTTDKDEEPTSLVTSYTNDQSHIVEQQVVHYSRDTLLVKQIQSDRNF